MRPLTIATPSASNMTTNLSDCRVVALRLYATRVDGTKLTSI